MSSAAPSEGSKVIRAVLAASAPRPDPTSVKEEKIRYAMRFANEMAKQLEVGLARRLPGISASAKRTAAAAKAKKQLDVNFSTPEYGLALGLSLKSVHLREHGRGYTHNMKRNEEELRIEASGYHKRQPYAVMVAVLLLPFDSCDDGKKQNASSFGSWVRHLRPYTGREDPDDEIDRFEKMYVALYEPDGSDLRFFDVEADPPKNRRPPGDGPFAGGDGRPRRLLSYAEFLDAVHHRYLRRNKAEFRWADGEEDPLDVEEQDGP